MSEFRLFPERASEQAAMVDAVFFAMTGFAAFFTIAILAAIIFFAIRYRKGSPASRQGQVHQSLLVEATWITIPALLLLAIFGWAVTIYVSMADPPGEALNIYVLGKQWMWKFQHEGGRQELNDLTVPVDTPIRLTMASQDVIHSFYVPAFRVKQDVVPGMWTETWFRALEPGRYHLFCAEYCGTSHSQMVGTVRVLAQDEYAAWESAGDVSESLAARGAALYQQLGCSGCHGPDSTYKAPKLEGIFGRFVVMQDGSSVYADEAYLRDSILLPKKHVVAGYEPIMPSYQGQVSAEDLFALAAWIKAQPLDSKAPIHGR